MKTKERIKARLMYILAIIDDETTEQWVKDDVATTVDSISEDLEGLFEVEYGG